VLIEMGRKEYKDAIERIETLRKERPDEARLLSLLSGCYGELNQTDKQIEILEKLVAMAPRDPLYTNNLGYFLAERQQDLTRAEKLIRNSLRANPAAVSTIDSLGWVFYKQGRFGRAGEVFLGLLEKAKAYDAENPESEPMVHPIILDHAGDTFWQLGWKKLALEAWSHALKSTDRVKENSPDLEFVKSKTPAKIKAAEAGESPATADYDKTYKPPAEPEPQQADGRIQLNF
jgi:tetratricopeptide (TPR) repeat protein